MQLILQLTKEEVERSSHLPRVTLLGKVAEPGSPISSASEQETVIPSKLSFFTSKLPFPP